MHSNRSSTNHYAKLEVIGRFNDVNLMIFGYAGWPIYIEIPQLDWDQFKLEAAYFNYN